MQPSRWGGCVWRQSNGCPPRFINRSSTLLASRIANSVEERSTRQQRGRAVYWQYRIHQHNRDHYTKRCLLYEREELSFFHVQHIYGVIVFDLRLTQLYSSADTMQALGRYYRIGCCPPTNKDTIMPQEINSLFASALSSSQDCN